MAWVVKICILIFNLGKLYRLITFSIIFLSSIDIRNDELHKKIYIFLIIICHPMFMDLHNKCSCQHMKINFKTNCGHY